MTLLKLIVVLAVGSTLLVASQILSNGVPIGLFVQEGTRGCIAGLGMIATLVSLVGACGALVNIHQRRATPRANMIALGLTLSCLLTDVAMVMWLLKG